MADYLVTSSSSDDVSVSPDRRQNERFITILRVGIIDVGDRRELCLIRNISSGGVMIHVYSDLAVGQRVALEFRNGRSVDAQVRWLQGELAGLAFQQPENVQALLENHASALDGQKPRPPRVQISCFATLERKGAAQPVLVHDISQGGVKIEGANLAPGDHVVIALPDMAAVAGTVRWVSKGMAGIAFVKPLGYPELASWLRQICASTKSSFAPESLS